jgi:methylglutaconyl-CoA hydratase
MGFDYVKFHHFLMLVRHVVARLGVAVVGRPFCHEVNKQTLSNLQHLRVETKGNSIWVTMNRPSVHNSFNEEVIAELSKTFRILGADSALDPEMKIRAIVLTGEGKSFSAGADLSWMKKMAGYSFSENKADAERLFDMFAAIKSNSLPVIARVNGAALGGGSGLVSACDFSLAVRKAKFGFTEVKLGLIPAVISSFVLEKIGSGNAARYFTTGEMFDGKEAERIGLVQHVYETEEEMDEGLTKILDQLANGGPHAVRNAKSLIAEVQAINDPHKLRDFCTDQISQARATEEGKEGVQSFLDKRKPNWAPTPKE